MARTRILSQKVRQNIVHHLSCMEGPLQPRPIIRTADDLLAQLVEWTDGAGRYFAEPALVRRLFWWQQVSRETIQGWLDELLERGDIRIDPLGENCYSSGPQDILTIRGQHRFQRFARRPRIPDEIRARVYARDGRCCLHCGSPNNLTLDHIHPRSRGGEDTIDNLQTLCRPCNSRKGARV